MLTKTTKSKNRIAVTDSQKLDKLARSIRDSYTNTARLASLAKNKASEAVTEAILCGNYLNQAKAIVGHGGWLKWLAEHCKGVHHNTAGNYMRLANSQHVRNLDASSSLRQAYISIGILPEKQSAPTPQPAQLTNGQTDAPKVEPAVIDAEVVAEEVLPAQITDTIRLNWLIKQGPPGAAVGIGLNGEAWELAYENVRETFSTEENQDRYCMRRAIDAAINATA